ncbi:uncharacterized protein Dana_GF27945, isoform C [Drosophila ananassae]|uniref:Uncharacterized protein, isoform C n=1 Tax=Drosophila ananassae TaxID=7217 RepID=A0A0N8NZH4_DROAN|nr:uncharacterized protein LOC26515354 [Drosophila ananassae]KPU74332.1 uncharacterized protein Dana_GF27945, isoform C [Drosophila ananassae]
MTDGYSIYDVAAYEEVDDSPEVILTPEEQNERDVQSIINLAQQEHEDQTHNQVIAAIKKRKEQELAKQRDINKFHPSFIRDNDQTEYAFKDLLEDLDVSSSDDSDEFDEYDDHYAYVINQKGSRGLFFHNLMYGEIS